MKNFLIFLTCITLFCVNGDLLKQERLGKILKRVPNICGFGSIFNGTQCEECGKSTYAPNVKIVGGVPAVPYSWPAQALLVQSYTGTWSFGKYGTNTISLEFQCGATLVSRTSILTAAHCLNKETIYERYGKTWRLTISPNKQYPTWSSMFKVYLGAQDISSIVSSGTANGPAVKVGVSNIVTHPSFDSDSVLNDIAIFKLSNSVNLNPNIKLACLPKSTSSAYPPSSDSVYAAGWGTLSYNGSPSRVLQNVKMNVYTSNYCSSVPGTKDWSRQICAGDYNGGRDTCQGDSGGGLYTYDASTQRYIVAGITSYGNGCGLPKSPGIYTRVSYYLDWIFSNL